MEYTCSSRSNILSFAYRSNPVSISKHLCPTMFQLMKTSLLVGIAVKWYEMLVERKAIAEKMLMLVEDHKKIKLSLYAVEMSSADLKELLQCTIRRQDEVLGKLSLAVDMLKNRCENVEKSCKEISLVIKLHDAVVLKRLQSLKRDLEWLSTSR